MTLDKVLTVPQFPPAWNRGITAPALLGEHTDRWIDIYEMFVCSAIACFLSFG